MNRDDILKKIKKCFALSSSGNEHEAEAALRQARKLMELHGLNDLDVAAAEAEERLAKAGAKVKPAQWESMLAAAVGRVFGCKVIFSATVVLDAGDWVFIGCGAEPEVARYAFTVLSRQARRAREHYIKAKLKRCKLAAKTRRADLFSNGWVWEATSKLESFAPSAAQLAAVAAFVERRYPNLAELQALDRSSGRKLTDREFDDLYAGQLRGKEAQLNRGVAGSPDQALLA
jgi:Protein of unknown function (DUF2786)